MITIKLLKDATLTALSGSIVNVSEGQYKALGDKAVIYEEQVKEDLKEEPVEDKAEVIPEKKAAKKTTAKSKK